MLLRWFVLLFFYSLSKSESLSNELNNVTTEINNLLRAYESLTNFIDQRTEYMNLDGILGLTIAAGNFMFRYCSLHHNKKKTPIDVSIILLFLILFLILLHKNQYSNCSITKNFKY